MLEYKIAPLTVPFDNSYKNAIRFDNAEQRKNYFNEDVLLANAQTVNLDLGTSLTTSIIYNFNEEVGTSQPLNFNYIIVKNIASNETLYYFITNTQYINGRVQVRFNVELDVLTTYLNDLNFSPALIKRAHLDRFQATVDDNTVCYNMDENSPFFNGDENQEASKYLVSKKDLFFRYELFYQQENVMKWLKDNVAYWVYVFCDITHDYPVKKISDDSKGTINGVDMGVTTIYAINQDIDVSSPDQYFGSPFACFCYPVYKNKGGTIKINGLALSQLGAQLYIKENNLSSYIWSQKISVLPPTSFEDFVVDGKNLTCEGKVFPYDTWITLPRGSEFGSLSCKAIRPSSPYCLLTGLKQNFDWITSERINLKMDDFLEYTDDNFSYQFNKKLLIGGTIEEKDFWKFNPTLLNTKFFDLKIVDATGKTFTYDLQKIISDAGRTPVSFEFKLTESLSPDLSRVYVSKLGSSGFYNQNTEFSYLGLLNSIDNSIGVQNSKYGDFIANNKNFALRAGIDAVERTVGGAVAGGTKGAITELGKSMISPILQVDDMKNAPGTIANANGNALQAILARNSTNFQLHYWRAPENELINANYQNMLYGYNLNRVANINDYINIRYYYNYIQAELENITSATKNLSNEVREKVKSIFMNGVRFWNVTENMFKFDKFNFERSLT